MQSRTDATTRYCSKLCHATCGITCEMFANDETTEKKWTQTQRNDLLSFRHRHSGVYLSSIRCNFVEFALARSRSYGVHKAHATAAAACTERTHRAVAQRRKEESNKLHQRLGYLRQCGCIGNPITCTLTTRHLRSLRTYLAVERSLTLRH